MWEARTPIEETEVRNEKFAARLKDSGVIGSTEFIKLERLRMKGFHKVLFLDCDIMFHKRFHELLGMEENIGWPVGAFASEKLNGGFLLYNPDHPASLYHMNRIIDILREGDYDRPSGFRGSGLGAAWGGETIQGILPYYYFVEANKEQEMLEQSFNFTLAPAHREIDRCRYNNMAQLDCSNVTYEEVTANHFTTDDTCNKPWYCFDREPLCTTFSTMFAKRYKEMVLELAHARTDMNGSGVVDFVNHLKDGEWCIDKKFVSVSAFLGEYV